MGNKRDESIRTMKRIVRCVNEDCDFERPVKEGEWPYKTISGLERTVTGHGYMVLCPICNCQTTIIDS